MIQAARRRIGAALGASLLLTGGTVGLGAPPAFAATTTSWSDPAGDTPVCTTDVTSGEASYAHDALTVALTFGCASDPASDPGWRDGTYAFGLEIDTDGDPMIEFEVTFNSNTFAPGRCRWTRWNEPNPDGTITGHGGIYDCALGTDHVRRHSLTVPASMVGAVRVRVRARMTAVTQRFPDGSSRSEGDLAPHTPAWSDFLDRGPAPPPPPPPPPPPRSGYWMVSSDGSVYAFGEAPHLGGAPTAAAEDLAPTSTGRGYWIVDAAGNVFSFGDAPYLGGLGGGLRPFERVTAITGTPDGAGYWLFTSLGRVATFGTALHVGDMGDTRLNGPVLDAIATPSGLGYYLVGNDGGIFTFGDASFRGSMGGVRLNAPVQSLVPDGDGDGYWLVASDGGIFAFDAEFYGSMGAVKLNRPVTGMVGSGSAGYLMVGEDGGIFTFGEATFRGSLGSNPPPRPITSVAVLPVP